MLHPDADWQGPEVAYDMVYGGGSLPWEWQKENSLRSIVHPSIYALVYYIL